MTPEQMKYVGQLKARIRQQEWRLNQLTAQISNLSLQKCALTLELEAALARVRDK